MKQEPLTTRSLYHLDFSILLTNKPLYQIGDTVKVSNHLANSIYLDKPFLVIGIEMTPNFKNYQYTCLIDIESSDRFVFLESEIVKH